MNSIVKKFINYLNTCDTHNKKNMLNILRKNTSDELISSLCNYIDKESEIINITRLLTPSQKEWKDYTEIFYEFDLLSEYLQSSPLTNKEKFYIIMRLVKRNIATGLLNERMEIFDPKKNTEYKFENYTIYEALQFLRQKEYKTLQKTSDDMLSDEEKQMKKELDKYAEECVIDGSKIISQHKKIQEHYLSKKKLYDINDIEIVITTLKEMKVDSNLCDSIKDALLEEQQKKVEPKVNAELFKVAKENSPTLSKKEYHELLKEVKQYIDLDKKTVSPYCHIGLSDKVYLAQLLKKLNYKDNEIKDILRIIDRKRPKQNINQKNPIEQYNTYYNKIKYYSEKGYCINELKELKDYCKEIFITNDQDYVEWKMMMQKALRTTLEMIPSDYEYELQEAITYTKK